MQPELRLFLFIIFVTYVLITAFNFLLVGIFHRLRGKRAEHSRAYLIVSRTCLTIAFIGFLCVLYGRFIEPNWPEVTHVQIKTTKVAKATGPVRIVHISDIHSYRVPALEPRLPKLIADQRPDIILYTGDSVNVPEGLPIFRDVITKIAKIAPTYAVMGNWDLELNTAAILYDGTGVTELAGRHVRAEVRGTPIWVAGIAQWHDDQVWPSMRGIPRSEFSIFMYHSPDGIEPVSREKIDLYCAGHTHGGQVALPFYGAMVTNSSYDKQFEAGLFKMRDTWLYVNRGIGMTGRVPRVRFMSRPEITVIELVPQG
ncbi:MAG TPA: metallophosphoesterase [Terriglobales bacterium]|nr:metallophosphoesterase [Terriglobales bacterium]